MAVDVPQTVLVANFASRDRAERFVEALRQAGFPSGQIGVLAPDEAATQVEDTALAGAMTGGTAGVLAGLALAAGLVPGVGPVLAGGLLAGALGGAAVGAAAGGVLGGLLALGIPEEEARAHESHLRAGRTLVVVRAAGRYPEALAILRRCEADADAPRERLRVEELDPLRGDGP
jgi:hypothetical protein